MKTHLLPDQLVPDDPAIPAVYLVRDGRDAVVSMAHHQADLVHPGTDYREALRETILAEDGSRERFFRRGQPGAWREEMPEHEQRRFRKLHGSALLRLGYKPDRLGGQIRYYTRRVIGLATARGSQIGP